MLEVLYKNIFLWLVDFYISTELVRGDSVGRGTTNMKSKLRTQKENTHLYSKMLQNSQRVWTQSQLFCFKTNVEIKEGLVVKGLDGQLKILAIIFHDDKYSKGKLSAVVVRGINKNLKNWVTTENPKPQVIPENLIFPAPIIYLPQK